MSVISVMGLGVHKALADAAGDRLAKGLRQEPPPGARRRSILQLINGISIMIIDVYY